MSDRRRKDKDLGPTMPAIFLGAVAAKRLAREGEARPAKALELARSMKAQGATSDQIYRQTSAMLDGTPYAGVHYGADGLARFEVSDANAKVRPVAFGKSGRALQGDVLTHPEFYRIYPEAAFLEVQKKGATGAGYTGTTVILGEDKFSRRALAGRSIPSATARGANLHELQHFAQEMEGFAPGGTPDDFKDRLPGRKNQKLREQMYRSLAGEVEAENTRNRSTYTAEARRKVSPLKTQAIPHRDQIVTDQSGGFQEEFGGQLPRGYDVQRNTDGSRVNYRIMKGREHVGNAWVRDLGDRVQMDLIDLDPKHQRKGIATSLYAKIERDYGKPIVPDDQLSAKALKFWKKHRPEQVRNHITLSDGSAVLDPRDAATFERRISKSKDRMQAMFGGDIPKGYKIDKKTNSIGQTTYRIMKGRKQVGEAYVRDLRDRVQVGRISIDAEHQRKGIATALYAQIESDAGKPLVPDHTLSPKAADFWRKHRPEALADHRPLGDGSLMIDPLGIFTRKDGRLQAMVEKKPRTRKAKVAPKIEDIGEKIGGARKDKAVKTGPKKAKAAVTDTRPGWMKRFEVSEVVSSMNQAEVGKFYIYDTRTKDWTGQARKASRQAFTSRAEAERAIPLLAVSQKHRVRQTGSGDAAQFQIWRTVTDRKAVQVVQDSFPSHEAAMRYLAENASKVMETKTGFGEEIIAKPEQVWRKGPQYRKGPVKGPEFVKELKFRGVEFGNWNSQAERAEVMNHAYDAMQDLSKVLGVKPESLTLKNQLGLAFGARGHGGKNAAAAHYERSYGTINLTKMSGAGSLAHEWAHAFDHYVSRVDNPKLQERVRTSTGDLVFPAIGREGDYASHGFLRNGSQAPDAVKTAMKSLMETMTQKKETTTVELGRYEKAVDSAKKNLGEYLDRIRSDLTAQRDPKYYKRLNAPASPEQIAKFETAAAKLLAGEGGPTEYRYNSTPGQSRKISMAGRWTNDTLDTINGVMKEVRGRQGFGTGPSHNTLDYVRSAASRLESQMKELARVRETGTQTMTVRTEFLRQAQALDRGRASDYWSTPHEMFARGFSTYVEDKAKALGIQSDFLSYGSDNELPHYKIFGIKPFPEGPERQAINRAMQVLIDQSKATGLLQAADDMPAIPTKARAAATAAAIAEGSGLRGTQNPNNLAAILENRPEAPKVDAPVKEKPAARAAVIGDNGGPSDQAVKTAAKLEAAAKRAIEKAEAEINRPRQENTGRRARMASGARDNAHQTLADAKTALKIAEALRNGEAGPLSNVKSLADVRELRLLARAAENATDRVQNRNYKPGGYGLQADDVKNLGSAKGFVSIDQSDLASMEKNIAGKKGLGNAMKVIRRYAESTTRGGRTDFSTSDPKVMEAVKQVATAIRKDTKLSSYEKYRAGRYLEEIRDFERSVKVAGATADQRQTTLRAFLGVKEAKAAESPIAIAERNLIGRKIPGFFPTPESLAKRMAELADIQSGQTVLEPSAGTGRLADVAKARGAKVEAVEMVPDLRNILQQKGHSLVASDFNELPTTPKYDRIIMNPPFEKGQDMAHVRRAYEMLKPGGKMVAVMGEGGFFRSDSQATGFRSWLDTVGGVSEKLPEGTFKESNTGVNTRLVTITKPAAVAEQALQTAAKTTNGQNPGWSDAAREASAEVRAANAEPSAAVKAVQSGNVKKAAAALGTNQTRAHEVVKAFKAGKLNAENIDKIAAMSKPGKLQAMAERPTKGKPWAVVDTARGNEVVYRFATAKEARKWAAVHNADYFDSNRTRPVRVVREVPPANAAADAAKVAQAINEMFGGSAKPRKAAIGDNRAPDVEAKIGAHTGFATVDQTIGKENFQFGFNRDYPAGTYASVEKHIAGRLNDTYRRALASALDEAVQRGDTIDLTGIKLGDQKLGVVSLRSDHTGLIDTKRTKTVYGGGRGKPWQAVSYGKDKISLAGERLGIASKQVEVLAKSLGLPTYKETVAKVAAAVRDVELPSGARTGWTDAARAASAEVRKADSVMSAVERAMAKSQERASQPTLSSLRSSAQEAGIRIPSLEGMKPEKMGAPAKPKPQRVVKLGDGRNMPLGKYVEAWTKLKGMDPQTRLRGTPSDPTGGGTVADALRELRAGMDDRINRHDPKFGKGRKWDADWQNSARRLADTLRMRSEVPAGQANPVDLRPRLAAMGKLEEGTFVPRPGGDRSKIKPKAQAKTSTPPKATPQVAPMKGMAPIGAKQAPTSTADWLAGREAAIKASKAAGNKHLDSLPRDVEGMRGVPFRNVHDPKERGVVRTVANTGDVVVQWLDDYSAKKNLADTVKAGNKKVAQSWLAPTDLKDYVAEEKPMAIRGATPGSVADRIYKENSARKALIKKGNLIGFIGFQNESTLNAALKAQGKAEVGKAKPATNTAAGQKAMWEDADRRSRSLMTQYAENQRGPNALTEAERTKLADKRPEYEFMRPKKGSPKPVKAKPALAKTPEAKPAATPKQTVAQLKAEAKAAGVKGASKMNKAALMSALGKAWDKTGRVSMIAAPVLAGAAAYYGTRDAAMAAGVDSKTANTEAAKAAAVTSGTVVGAMAVIGTGIKAGMKVLAKAAPAAAGPAGWAVAGGLTAWGAYQAYQIHKDSGRGIQAAALSLVGADAALHLVKPEAKPEPAGTPRNLSAGPTRLNASQKAEFTVANEAHKAMKDLTESRNTGPTGWSDQARIAAYEERMNRAGKVAKNAPYHGAPRK